MASRAVAAPKNPGSFADALSESNYAHGLGKGQRLRREREKSVGRLRRKCGDSLEAQALADKLDACEPNSRCKSAACPECAAAGQKLMARILKKYLEAQPHQERLVCVSVVPADGTCSPGQLSKGQHDRNTRRWKEAMGRAGVEWFVGANDYSFNEHLQNRYPPHWAEHIYGFTTTDDPAKLKKALLAQFLKTDASPRPVKVAEWDGDARARKYVLKPNFWRRIGTDTGQRFGELNGEKRRCRDTDKQPLLSRNRRELLLHLDEVGLQGRLFLRWCQFTNLRGSGPTIVDRRPNGRTPGKQSKP